MASAVRGDRHPGHHFPVRRREHGVLAVYGGIFPGMRTGRVAVCFQACGLDVWLYDYRGFGGSSEFEIDRDCLFHNEFVADFQACGLDVWLYDYRGFGGSSEFEIDRDCLFHNEFVEDLAAVAGYVYKKTSAAPVLLGLSMGTIIINEYLKDTDIPVTHVIYDGYAGDPEEWVNKLKANGKDVKLPDGYLPGKHKNRRLKTLYIVGLEDGYSSAGNIPFRKSKKTTVKTFDSGHISSFNQYPEEYTVEILNFLIDK